jgi:protein-disulfide isomerase
VAAQCAHRQGKFWEYGGKLFENQGQLDREDLRRHAQEVGLDLAAFTDCLGDPEALAAVKRDIELGEVLQIRATPTSYVNDVEITGALPPPLFDAVVEELLARRPPQ